MPKHEDKLSCKLDRYENSYAVLHFDISKIQKFDIKLPKRYLPKNAKVGDIIDVRLFSRDEMALQDKHLAQFVLDEIIGDSK